MPSYLTDIYQNPGGNSFQENRQNKNPESSIQELSRLHKTQEHERSHRKTMGND